MAKKTKKNRNNSKKTTKISLNTDSMSVIWTFDEIDRNGKFAFDLNIIEKDKNLITVLEKQISYNLLTWHKIKQQTHDNGKSKHHFLPYEGLSADAIKSIKNYDNNMDFDNIFSFALNNKLRIIGKRDGQIFHVIWYDPKHQFYPIKK